MVRDRIANNKYFTALVISLLHIFVSKRCGNKTKSDKISYNVLYVKSVLINLISLLVALGFISM